MGNILIMRDIDKSFPGVKALDKAQLEVKKGEVHVLLGENGAGKSTLMKILVGTYSMDAGEVYLNGEQVHFKGFKDAQNAGIGIVYQEFNLIPQLTVAENIYIGRVPLKKSKQVNWKKMYQDSGKILDLLKSKIDPTARVAGLGVAQQQMVEIAKAISANAQVIVMDEPTAALTEAEIDALFDVIRDLKSQGVSIIYISHRLEEIKRIGDRATVMRDGQYIGTVDIATTSLDDIVKMMIGRDLVQKFPPRNPKPGEEVLRAEHIQNGKAVKDVSFYVKKGEIVGFAGLVGAGRTETMRALFGADRAQGGTVFVEGKEVKIVHPWDAIKHGIGFLTEDRKSEGLMLNFNILMNVSITNLKKILGGVRKLDLKKEQQLVDEMCKRLNVKTPSLKQKAAFLSGGNQQKVVLAKWLFCDCKVLVFDEPTRGIDVGAKTEIYNLMNELTDLGAGIIMISSELPEILGMSDRIYVMHLGNIAGELNREEANQELILEYAAGLKQQ